MGIPAAGSGGLSHSLDTSVGPGSGRRSSVELLAAVLLAALLGAMVGLAGTGMLETAWSGLLLAALAVVGIFALILGWGRWLARAPGVDGELARALAEANDAAVALVRDGTRVVDANAAYLRLAGAGETPKALLGAMGPGAMADLLHAVARGEAAKRSFAGAEAGEDAFSVRVVPLSDARHALWVIERRPAPEMPAAAEPVAEAVAAEVPPGLSLTRTVALLEHAPVGVCVLSADRVRLANATLARWLGYPLAEWGAEGMPLAEVVKPAFRVELAARLAAREGAGASLDLDLTAKDGSPFAARLQFAEGDGKGGERLAFLSPRAVAPISFAPAPSASVPPVRGQEREEASTVFARAPLAMASVDRAGRILSVNASFERLFAPARGKGAGGWAGAALTALVGPNDGAPLSALLDAARAADPDRAPAPACEVAIAGEATRSARLYAAKAGPGEAGLMVYAVDTTAQKALEAQFAQSQKMQAVGQLAGGVAHDFNNVLTAIIGYCDLLLASHRPSDPSFPDIMQIKQNANRAAALVRQLLAFSRRQTLRPQVIQLTDVISDISQMLARLIGETITLNVEHARDLWPVKVDVNQFEQVVLNLVVNARDAMPEGGTLTLSTRNVPAAECAAFGEGALVPADYVMVEVEDTGTGIDPAIMDKIFEPFFSTKEVGKGTGLGLSTVYGIVQQTGGTILASSEMGKGSAFRVFLPRHTGEAEDKAPKAAETEAKAADLTGQGTVLLVEDEDAVRAFAARALSGRGYKVLTAGSGVEALAVMEEAGGAVDLVVSDVVMPEMDGPTLLRELRARRPDLKVIFMSGYAEEAFARNLPPEEKFAFLPKPFSLKQLVEAVKDAVRG